MAGIPEFLRDKEIAFGVSAIALTAAVIVAGLVDLLDGQLEFCGGSCLIGIIGMLALVVVTEFGGGSEGG